MATITNVYTNPSVETNMTSWNALGTGTTAVRSGDQALAGTVSLKVTTTATGASRGIQQSVGTLYAVSPGQTWTVSLGLYGAGDLRIEVSERGAAGAGLATQSTRDVTLGAMWTRYDVTRTISNASAQYLALYVYTRTAQAVTFYVDAMMMTQTATAPEYFDGDSDSAEWTGTAHASASVLTLPDTSRTIHPVLQIGSSYVGPLRVGKG